MLSKIDIMYFALAQHVKVTLYSYILRQIDVYANGISYPSFLRKNPLVPSIEIGKAQS